MKARKKSAAKNSIGRFVFVACFFLIQTLWILFLIVRLNQYSYIISLLMTLLSVVFVIKICANNMNSDMKLAWIIAILIFPIWGISIYLMYGRKSATRKKRKEHEKLRREISVFAWEKAQKNEISEIEDIGIANQCRYLEKYAGYPLYQNTDVTYYKDASDGLRDQMKAISQAKKYIFLEYFAIENVEPFVQMKELLMQKVKEGVEVRIIYDDVGSMGFIAPDFVKEMESVGIKCRIFNQIVPALRIFMNNRDHRKIMVIDGKVGFTGGYNLANEYFNLTEPFPYGYWKDTGIRMTGDAVATLTAMFLEMWNFIKKTDEKVDVYFEMEEEKNETEPAVKEDAFVLPYADSPLDDEMVGENVYLNMIKNAKKYIWFVTPYLIISDLLSNELTLAAKRGVDVRIITPGIPDKKLIYQVTKSYYPELLEGGVKIYEFTPGFCHAKQCVCDGKVAVIGTINLDFRSLYHHFENGVFLYGTKAIEEMNRDFEETFEKCRKVPATYGTDRSAGLLFVHEFLHLFATLL